jgi:hypothetical protein
MGAVARDPIGLAQLVGLCHHHLPAAERTRGSGLRRRAGGNLDVQLGLEVENHLLRVGVALREVDGNAAEHDNVDARRCHLARRLHADVVGAVDLVLAAYHDRERGEDERHPGGNDPVELVGEDLGGERGRGVPDARPISVNALARRGRRGHCWYRRLLQPPTYFASETDKG